MKTHRQTFGLPPKFQRKSSRADALHVSIWFKFWFLLNNFFTISFRFRYERTLKWN
jgi:hypothetical protein